MEYKKNMEILGNGCYKNGVNCLEEICQRLEHARKKHPVFAVGLDHGANVVYIEAGEMIDAALHEGKERAHDEALDVIATAVRFCNKEWMQ